MIARKLNRRKRGRVTVARKTKSIQKRKLLVNPPPIPIQGSPVLQPPVTVHDRVAWLVKRWAHLDELPSDDDLLATLWAPQAYPYNPDGAQLLAIALQKEFSEPPVICQSITVSMLTGAIKSVALLVSAVLECPEP
jgi:hypothetical protein